MIDYQLRPNEGILVVLPDGPLQKSDFDELAMVVDPYIEGQGRLNGLLIQVESFPGWQDFAAMQSHFTFVKAHHRKIKRVAAVADGAVLSLMPAVADHFVAAEVKHFEFNQEAQAMKWLSEES